MRVVIIGAGQAAVDLALALRELGHTDDITILGDEPHAPYQRPVLSKQVLMGTSSPYDASLREPAYFSERSIRILVGDPVASVDFDGEESSGSVLTVGGSRYPFDALAFATGGSAAIPPVPGLDAVGAHTLRTLDDALALRSSLDIAESVAIVGAGFIGLEVAAAARARGLSVTVVEAQSRVMARSTCPEVSEFVQRMHEESGISFLLDAQVASVAGARGDCTVNLADGTVVPADLVIVGAGMRANAELARAAGLLCENGIVVDAAARTSRTGVVAVGDCSAVPHPDGTGRVLLESVPHATEQARIAAHSLLGLPVPEPTTPWFWSDQGNVHLQKAGLPQAWERVVVRRHSSSSMSALLYREDALVGIESVNCVPDFTAGRRALQRSLAIDRDSAADTSVPLKSLLV